MFNKIDSKYSKIDFNNLLLTVLDDDNRKIGFFSPGDIFGNKCIDVINSSTGLTTRYVFNPNDTLRYKSDLK